MPVSSQCSRFGGQPADSRCRLWCIHDKFLDKLLITCHSIISPSHLWVCCSGAGCRWSWAEPWASVWVLQHAHECLGLGEDLCTEANWWGVSLSLASKLQSTHKDASPENASASPSLETQQQKISRVDCALLKWLCDQIIPPSTVDCLRWWEIVSALTPDISTASGMTMTDNFVTTEAAYIHEELIKQLSQQEWLTLSYNGGTTQKHESVYTVHVTTPSTRNAYLMDGNGASGVSHTAKHICNVIDKVSVHTFILLCLLTVCLDFERGQAWELHLYCFSQCWEYTSGLNAHRARIPLDYCASGCMPSAKQCYQGHWRYWIHPAVHCEAEIHYHSFCCPTLFATLQPFVESITLWKGLLQSIWKSGKT